MRVIPAIDLKDGQCVRLQKGDYGTAHKVAENPVETAQRFLDAVQTLYTWLTLTPLRTLARELRRGGAVIRETGATVELGGGIRSMQDVRPCLHWRSRVINWLSGCPRPGIRSRGCKKVQRQDRCAASMPRARPSARTAGWATAVRTTSRSRSAWSPSVYATSSSPTLTRTACSPARTLTSWRRCAPRSPARSSRPAACPPLRISQA